MFKSLKLLSDVQWLVSVFFKHIWKISSVIFSCHFFFFFLRGEGIIISFYGVLLFTFTVPGIITVKSWLRPEFLEGIVPGLGHFSTGLISSICQYIWHNKRFSCSIRKYCILPATQQAIVNISILNNLRGHKIRKYVSLCLTRSFGHRTLLWNTSFNLRCFTLPV